MLKMIKNSVFPTPTNNISNIKRKQNEHIQNSNNDTALHSLPTTLNRLVGCLVLKQVIETQIQKGNTNDYLHTYLM